MAIRGFNESSLGTSEIWNGLNKSADGESTKDKAVRLINSAQHLTNQDIEAAYISVKQISESLTREALKAFDSGKIVLVYNKVSSLSVTQALPFITFKMKDGKYKTYVFMDKYVTITRDGILNVQAPVFRDLLVGALISNSLKYNYQIMASNQYLQKIFTDIYCDMFTRILNRQFAIAADKIVYETLCYWIKRFFLVHIFGTNDINNIETIASSHFKAIDEMKYDEIKKEYDTADPVVVSDLLNLLKTASPRMKTLSLGIFLNDWINYYYIPSMLAVDNMEYFIFMILTLLNGNNIISIAAGDIVKETKNIKNLRGELLKLIQ